MCDSRLKGEVSGAKAVAILSDAISRIVAESPMILRGKRREGFRNDTSDHCRQNLMEIRFGFDFGRSEKGASHTHQSEQKIEGGVIVSNFVKNVLRKVRGELLKSGIGTKGFKGNILKGGIERFDSANNAFIVGLKFLRENVFDKKFFFHFVSVTFGR